MSFEIIKRSLQFQTWFPVLVYLAVDYLPGICCGFGKVKNLTRNCAGSMSEKNQVMARVEQQNRQVRKLNGRDDPGSRGVMLS